MTNTEDGPDASAGVTHVSKDEETTVAGASAFWLEASTNRHAVPPPGGNDAPTWWGVKASGFSVYGSVSRIEGSRFGFQSCGVRFEGRGLRVEGRGLKVEGRGLMVEGLGFRVSGLGSVVQALGSKV